MGAGVAADLDLQPAASTANARLDAFLDSVYDRFGINVLLRGVVLGWAMGLVYGTAGLFLFARIVHQSMGRAATALFICIPTLFVATAVGVLVTRRFLRPVIHWRRLVDSDAGSGPEFEQAALDSLDAVLAFPRVAVVRNAAVALLVGFPGLFVAVHLITRFTLATTVQVLAEFVMLIAVLMVLTMFEFQLLVRPVIRDILSSTTAVAPVVMHTSMRFKLLVAVPFLAFGAAVGGAAIAVPAGANVAAGVRSEALGGLIGLLFAVPCAVIMARSTTVPISELLNATERLKRGDYTTRVPELSADEYGVMARSFNEAMVGLAERQRLAEENERLLSEVRASRARIIAASDAERRRIERNIHDGAQQRLVALSLDMAMLEDLAADTDSPELQARLASVAASIRDAHAELRELARGLHPSVLTSDGLAPALRQLAERAPVPVGFDVGEERYPETIESTAYFVTAEALANMAKYARATRADVSVSRRNGSLVLRIADDGVGGAHPQAGSGLAGLADRVAAVEGTFAIDSPAGRGTRLLVELPLHRSGT